MAVRKDRFGGAVVAAVALAAVLAIPPSRAVTVVAAPVDPPQVQVELGALQRAALPLQVPLNPVPVVAPTAPTAPTEPVAPSVPAAEPVVGDSGIPVRVLAAYRHAADLMAATDPGCHVDWTLLAGIGRIESGHAAGGRVDAAGTTRGRILGPVLDGSLAGSTVVTDTDGGALDGDPRFDRATGPMQFLPATWRSVGADGNTDGVADPNNVDDAALGAARYLCAGGGDLRDAAAATAALFRYNRSAAYGANVLAWAQAYRTGATAVPDLTGPVPAGEPGPQVLAAAEGAPAPAPATAATPALPPTEPRPGVDPAPPPPIVGPLSPPAVTPPPVNPPAPTSPAALTGMVRRTSAAPPAVTTSAAPPTTSPVPTTRAPTTVPPTTVPPTMSPPVITSAAPPTTAPACPAATVAASTTRVLPDETGLLVRFALPPVPAGCRVATATVTLDPGPDAAGATLAVRRPTAAWSATTATAPVSVGPEVVSPATAGARRLTVTGLVTALYAGPDHGLLVRGAGAPLGPVRLTVTLR